MDPKISMWLGVDPLTEKYISVSGYVYCIGNPIRFVDPNGCWHWEKNGNLHADRKDNTKTLAQFLGTSQKDVLQILNRNNIRTTKGGKAVSTCKCTNDCKVKKYFHKSIQTENENSIFLSDDDLFCL